MKNTSAEKSKKIEGKEKPGNARRKLASKSSKKKRKPAKKENQHPIEKSRRNIQPPAQQSAMTKSAEANQSKRNQRNNRKSKHQSKCRQHIRKLRKAEINRKRKWRRNQPLEFESSRRRPTMKSSENQESPESEEEALKSAAPKKIMSGS